MEWKWNDKFRCWCLEEVEYTPKAQAPQYQRMSVFVPEAYMSAPGILIREHSVNGYTAVTAPVVFENNSAGYRQMPPVRLGQEECFAEPYLAHGFIYVTCGNRGSESIGPNGRFCGKAPANLIDLKTAVRFLRRHKAYIPGNMERIISVGCSAGGAMSALLAVTGNHRIYNSYLEENGAYMDERDDVYAAQCYCPVTDLEHADMAYEWMFSEELEKGSFQYSLSQKLREAYIRYFNERKLGVSFEEGGRSGSAYDYLMEKLECAKKRGREKEETKSEGFVPGLDAHVREHCRRKKRCPAFDSFERDSSENRVFGTPEEDYRHFNPKIADMIQELKEEYPEAYDRYYDSYQDCCGKEDLRRQMDLINPLNFILSDEECTQADYYRIRVGTCDGDTSFSVSMMLALMLEKAGKDVDYELVWDMPHCEADYPGEVQAWIERICR